MNPSELEKLVEQVVSRLSPEQVWEMSQGCRLVCTKQDADRIRYIVECGAERIGWNAGEGVDTELAQYIDHTLLRASASEEEIQKICTEAAEYGFASVCVNPHWVRFAAQHLAGSTVQVCTVAGFPLGANTTDVKEFETRRAVFDGATEIDMVVNIGALKSAQDDVVLEDIRRVVSASHEGAALCKVIIETAFLTDDEKVKASVLAKRAGADFVKTSTGFGPGGATADDVALMRRAVGPGLGVKAAGGIKNLADTRAMLEAGATRIGASAGVKIVKGEESTGAY